MILEVATLDLKHGEAEAFQAAFSKAESIIASMKGYIDHELKRSMENPDRFLLLVHWNTLEDHTEGFRGSPEYQDWKRLLHHFYDPFPTVEHFRSV